MQTRLEKPEQVLATLRTMQFSAVLTLPMFLDFSQSRVSQDNYLQELISIIKPRYIIETVKLICQENIELDAAWIKGLCKTLQYGLVGYIDFLVPAGFAADKCETLNVLADEIESQLGSIEISIMLIKPESGNENVVIVEPDDVNLDDIESDSDSENESDIINSRHSLESTVLSGSGINPRKYKSSPLRHFSRVVSNDETVSAPGTLQKTRTTSN